jgi:hypothetical protein
MWVAVVVVVALLMVALLARPSRRRSSPDGPLPPDVEAQVLLGETPEAPTPPADEDRADGEESGER